MKEQNWNDLKMIFEIPNAKRDVRGHVAGLDLESQGRGRRAKSVDLTEQATLQTIETTKGVDRKQKEMPEVACQRDERSLWHPRILYSSRNAYNASCRLLTLPCSLRISHVPSTA